ncbi:hypothetical protein KKH15_02480 [Patescibacteria group bacterium]|nr:hypothetical protein [Patescibacteria group bacterium]MBU1755133.1 hypothetical protein [Patescibacteria group bacterium]
MPDEEVESSLERLRRKLYNNAGTQTPVPHPLSAPKQYYAETPEPLKVPKKEGLPFAVKFFIITLVFFLFAGGVAAALLFFGTRSVSTDEIGMSVDGPLTIASGETVSFLVGIDNKNPMSITATKLTVDFPEGTRNPDSVIDPLVRYSDPLGDIPAGGRVERTVRAAIYGTENQTVTVPVTLEYRTEGSSAIFVKKQDFTFTITTSPLSLTVTTLKQTASGQPLTVQVAVRSNAKETLKDIAVRGVYPFGFTQTSATPTPSPGPLFRIGELKQGEEKTITINGVLVGQEQDERVFKFTAGTALSGAPDLNVPYSSKESIVQVTKPFLAVSLALNRENVDNAVVAPGESVQVSVSWLNTLQTPVTDGQISVRLAGDALDLTSISSNNGFYRSSDKTVFFNRETNAGLKYLEPGDTGSGSFVFNAKSASALSGLRNPVVTLNVSVAGRRTGETGVPESVTSTMTRTVQIQTDAVLTSSMTRTTGPFTNTGPWPPEPDVESTYTVNLTLDNSLNSIADGAVSMTIPSYVRFTGAASPADGSLVYDADNRKITWRLGDIQPGSETRKMSFQIAFLPSTSQRGDNPVLISDQVFTGIDRFTKQALTATVQRLDTRITNDPAYKSEYGMVKR